MIPRLVCPLIQSTESKCWALGSIKVLKYLRPRNKTAIDVMDKGANLKLTVQL